MNIHQFCFSFFFFRFLNQSQSLVFRLHLHWEKLPCFDYVSMEMPMKSMVLLDALVHIDSLVAVCADHHDLSSAVHEVVWMDFIFFQLPCYSLDLIFYCFSLRDFYLELLLGQTFQVVFHLGSILEVDLCFSMSCCVQLEPFLVLLSLLLLVMLRSRMMEEFLTSISSWVSSKALMAFLFSLTHNTSI